MTELIIAEKPNAAKKIAEALAKGKAIKEIVQGVPYYRITHGSKDVIVSCAVGHLYSIAQKGKTKWTYPVFDVEWKPTYKIHKEAAFARKYSNIIRKLAKEADEFTVATDYDIEGEVIGLNIVRFLCNKKDAARMKFSTLTKPDLMEAYDKKSNHLDWGQAFAGLARHELDWYYGINISRALSLAIKHATGMHKILSSGRVQGPALKIIVEREKEIRDFKAKPFWQIELKGEVKKGAIDAWHIKDKFWDNKEADDVIKNCRGKKAFVKDVKKTETKQSPPTPFDLTTLQTEAYRFFGIQPKRTLEFAQELYTSGYISYPRTSSQKLPEKIGYSKIIKELGEQKAYSGLCSELLKKKLKPNEGKKTDPAHPAIYPTGIPPELKDKSMKVYDLIVRRFLATFSDPAVRQNVAIKIDVNQEIFVAKGTTTIDRGWHNYYMFAKSEEKELPEVSVNEGVKVKKLELHDKETQPPKRYSPASIIKELEKRNLGTKATRSEIVDSLFRRGYVSGEKIEATDLGIKTIETLQKYCPDIIDEKLTKHFEEEMEKIREQKLKPDMTLDEAKKTLLKVLERFNKHEKKIGKDLAEAYIETRKELEFVGKCPVCKQGDLQMRTGKFGRFIACNKYPECKTTFKLPAKGLIKPTEKKCSECSYPMVKIIRRGKRPQEICINTKCPSKEVKEEKTDKKCPKCGSKLILRKSIYGGFYGCSNYPKCKHVERI